MSSPSPIQNPDSKMSTDPVPITVSGHMRMSLSGVTEEEAMEMAAGIMGDIGGGVDVLVGDPAGPDSATHRAVFEAAGCHLGDGETNELPAHADFIKVADLLHKCAYLSFAKKIAELPPERRDLFFTEFGHLTAIAARLVTTLESAQ